MAHPDSEHPSGGYPFGRMGWRQKGRVGWVSRGVVVMKQGWMGWGSWACWTKQEDPQGAEAGVLPAWPWQQSGRLCLPG